MNDKKGMCKHLRFTIRNTSTELLYIYECMHVKELHIVKHVYILKNL